MEPRSKNPKTNKKKARTQCTKSIFSSSYTHRAEESRKGETKIKMVIQKLTNLNPIRKMPSSYVIRAAEETEKRGPNKDQRYGHP